MFIMKKYILIACATFFVCSTQGQPDRQKAASQKIELGMDVLKDKIRGGWAGQTIGVTFGGPYEFRYNGTFIQDYQPLLWYDGYIKKTMIGDPGLYDDLYMDLTFVDVFEKYGLDAPLDSFAQAFAHAGYKLWHANQSARYNILQGIPAAKAGFWMNNPHADDIDYQIESDYAGLMSPGMPNTASKISDGIGHLMNYGDGFYGGVFVGAMYTMAFTEKDISKIVDQALRTIPAQSSYYHCIADVIKWHKQYPDDWRMTWFKLQENWSSERGCPDGIFDPFDIDAKINSGYVVMALLYGNGDYGKTLALAARAGQDADCNPSTVGGILGTMLGYDHIPDYWKMGLAEAEDIPFKYTDISLNRIYAISLKQAIQNITRHGGSVKGDKVEIAAQQPEPVAFEESFPKVYPVLKKDFAQDIGDVSFSFEGTGFVLRGSAGNKDTTGSDYVFSAEISIDGKITETVQLPTNFTIRRNDLCWAYALPHAKHTVRVRLLNPNGHFQLQCSDYIVFSDKPVSGTTP